MTSKSVASSLWVELYVLLSFLQEQCSKLQADASENASKEARLSAQLEGVKTEKELLVGSRGDTEKQFKDMVEKLKVLSEEKQNLVISNTEKAKVIIFSL